MKLSKYMMDRGLAGMTRATTDRVGRATLLYHLIKTRDFVILDSCPETIKALPQCTRDEDNLEDVLKVETKGDDVYDSVALGLFGELGVRGKPQEEKDREKIDALEGDRAKFLMRYRLTQERNQRESRAEERPPENWE